MKMKKKDFDLKKIVAQIEKEFGQIDPAIFDRRNWKWAPFRRHGGDKWRDDDVLEYCCFHFDEALRKGASRKEALGVVSWIATEATKKGKWKKTNLYLLWDALDSDSALTPWFNNLAEMVNPDTIRGKKVKEDNKIKRKLRKTWKGKTVDEIQVRNRTIIEHYQKNKKAYPNLTLNSFVERHKGEYKLRKTQMADIIRNGCKGA